MSEESFLLQYKKAVANGYVGTFESYVRWIRSLNKASNSSQHYLKSIR